MNVAERIVSRIEQDQAKAKAKAEEEEEPKEFVLPACLDVADWLARDLPELDRLCGWWLSTTTRAMLVGPTGLGKSNFVMALAGSVAAGLPFLHWSAPRSGRVLYIDGEMSTRLLKRRLADACRRLGIVPARGQLLALSTADAEDLKPLNTAEGQAYLDKLIEAIGGVDLIVFDNIMSLISGDMKDEESWQATLPWARSLTNRSIGQIWVHHTGHDESKSYGSKTREWQLDVMMLMGRVDNPDTDIAFDLTFKKKRESTPETRDDFADVRVALVHDQWEVETGTKTAKVGKVSPLGEKFYDALVDAISLPEAVIHKGKRAASKAQWRAECERRGLINPDDNPKSATTLFNKHRRELIAANRVVGQIDLTWLPE